MDEFDELDSPPPPAPTGDDQSPVILLAPPEESPQIPSAPIDFDSFSDSAPSSYSESLQPEISSYQSIPFESEPVQSYEPAPSMSFLPDPEPEDALTVFNREWNKKLEAKRLAELEAEKVVQSKANEDTASWVSQRDIRLTAKKESNRSAEQVLLETIESEVDVNNIWERVTKLIDAGADTPDDAKADTTRMRKLFIQLKNEPLESTRAASIKA